jgi:hypothetical protein
MSAAAAVQMGAILLQRQDMVANAISTDEGKDLNAGFKIDRSAIILYSRGDRRVRTKQIPTTRRGPRDHLHSRLHPLRLLLRRLSDNRLTIRGTWVDSSRVQGLPLSELTFCIRVAILVNSSSGSIGYFG